MISDRNSRRSKGIAYIEFVEASSVPLAIGLTGQRLLGVPIIVQASQVGVDHGNLDYNWMWHLLCDEMFVIEQSHAEKVVMSLFK